QLWRSWGIEPEILLGHSVGELAAACVAGVFSLEDGLTLVAARGRLMGALPQEGEMVSLQATESRVRAAIAPYSDELSIAAINGPASVVLSGRRAAVLAVSELLAAEGVKSQRLTVSHAFHSPLMEPMLEEFRQVAERIVYHKPVLRLVSNVTGQVAGDEIATPGYWVRHVREAVRFADGVATLHSQGIQILLEIGPKPVLLGMAGGASGQWSVASGQWSVVSGQWGTGGRGQEAERTALLPSLRPGQGEWQQLLASLGELYVRGAAIDWEGFDRGYGRRKVALPTYPFQRQRYWAEEKRSLSVMQQSADWVEDKNLAERIAARFSSQTVDVTLVSRILDALRAEQHHREWFNQAQNSLYTMAWIPSLFSGQRRDVGSAGETAACWMILADRSGLGEELAVHLRRQGLSPLLVFVGSTFAVCDCEFPSWQVNPEDSNHWRQLLATVPTPVQGILYLWGLDCTVTAASSSQVLAHMAGRGCTSLLYLIQGLLERAGPGHFLPRLWVVTRDVHRIDGQGDVGMGLAQSPLWGLGLTIGLESPELWGGMVDLAAVAADNEAVHLWDAIKAGDAENQVALRGGQRYVLRLVQAETSAPKKLTLLAADATYLITGGLGVLGIQAARWLAGQGARSLVLVGRHKPDRAVRDVLQAIERQGVQIQVVSADVADPVAMQALFASLGSSLRGVIHAAGKAQFAPLRTLTAEDMDAALRAKVVGGWVLHQLTAEMKLDFFVLFSSIASIWGSNMQAHYSAANRFLDALAHYRQQLGLPGLSINWGPWADSLASTLQEQLARTGVLSLPSARALAFLGTLLAAEEAQRVVVEVDWPLFQSVYRTRGPQPLLDCVAPLVSEQTQTGQPSSLIQRLQQLPLGQRQPALDAEIQEQVRQVIAAASLPDLQQGFADLGMDSLMAVELKNRLERLIGQPLPATLAFNYPTVDRLSKFLLCEVLFLAADSALAEPILSSASTVRPLSPLDADDVRQLSASELMAIIASESEALNLQADEKG
ncbi:MAG: SDR family NAD(P)-dependent oxidoreductase, partial [Caldilinea sp.]|nr:SDR family NAD(P)-dependent oxidoreductase [Caldilinea sp.]